MDSLQKSFGEPELLSEAEGNGWRPEKGADKVDAHKGSSLVARGLPSILQCHLKRFNYDWQTDTMSKLNSRFGFPEVLDLSKLCGVEDGDGAQTIYDLQSVVIHMGQYGVGHYCMLQRTWNQCWRIACIHSQYSFSSSLPLADSYVRPDMTSDTWYRFNDDVVEEVSLEDVFADAYGGRSHPSQPPEGKKGPFRFFRRIFRGNSPSYGWGGETANAYVVQYIRRSDVPSLYKS